MSPHTLARPADLRKTRWTSVAAAVAHWCTATTGASIAVARLTRGAAKVRLNRTGHTLRRSPIRNAREARRGSC
jgi:hypothetical protein